MNMKDMLQKAQQMQKEMERMKAEAESKTVEVETGGGMVKITINGANRVTSLKIAKEIINPDDPEMLEDLVLAAVNKANEEAAEMVNEEMKKVSGMMPNIPGLNLGL